MKTENTNAAVAPVEVVEKKTPVNERKYELAKPNAPQAFKGKQRQIVFDLLLASKAPRTIAEIAKDAAAKGLTAVGGIEPSVRYHLHHMTLDGVTKVTNPIITVQ
jgi:hypothetical protein